MELNQKDELLISLLRENARLSVSEIARQLSVSRTAALARLEKLERNGVIDGYTVRLSAGFSNNRVRALVMIKAPPNHRASIEQALAKIPQLTSLYSISGAFELSSVISAASVGDLDKVIDEIGRIDGVDDTMSLIILSTKFDR